MTLLVATQDGLHDLDRGTIVHEGRDVTAVAVDDNGAVWALVGLEELWRGDELVAKVPIEYGTALGVGGGQVAVGTAGAHLLRLESGELVADEAFDVAPTRDEWHTPSGGSPAVRSMAFDSSGDLFVNVHVGGIIRGGAGWDPTIDLFTDVHQVVAGDGTLFAALGDAGLATSRDAGATWSTTTDGLPAAYARAVAVTAEHVLLSASTGPFTTEGAVYRAPRDGGRFEHLTDGIPERFEGNVDTGWVAASGATAAVAGPDGEVFRSRDEGSTWETVATGLPTPRWVTLADNA